MPTLIETYARCNGFKIDKPAVQEDFFPIPLDKYITIHAGSNQNAKNYDYYQLIIDVIEPVLRKHGIGIVLLGKNADPELRGVYDLREKTSIKQSFYILKRALLHLGNDSWTAHAAGWSNIPLISLYGNTSATIHGPFWKNKDKTILIESHRNGNQVSFGPENPKTINYIDPYLIINNVFKLLDINHIEPYKTVYIGPIYNHNVFDWIPNVICDPKFLPGVPLTARMDIEHNEEILAKTLQLGRKITIVTNKQINMAILTAFKDNILSYNHDIDLDCDKNYSLSVPKIINKTIFFTRLADEAEISKLKFQFFNYAKIERLQIRTREDFFTESEKFLNGCLDKTADLNNMRFMTNKFILSNGKAYPSYAHLEDGIECGHLTDNCKNVIDRSSFWKDMEHFLFLKNND